MSKKRKILTPVEHKGMKVDVKKNEEEKQQPQLSLTGLFITCIHLS
jgi:hypothetical protein